MKLRASALISTLLIAVAPVHAGETEQHLLRCSILGCRSWCACGRLGANAYLGHGDVRITYRDKGFEYTAMLRRNFDTGHGAVQAGLAFPLVNNLKGYTQVFAGYGQSLIDYNYSQKSVGAGILMDF